MIVVVKLLLLEQTLNFLISDILIIITEVPIAKQSNAPLSPFKDDVISELLVMILKCNLNTCNIFIGILH